MAGCLPRAGCPWVTHPSKQSRTPGADVKSNGLGSRSVSQKVMPASGLGPWPDSAFYFGGHQSPTVPGTGSRASMSAGVPIGIAQTVIDYYRRNKDAPRASSRSVYSSTVSSRLRHVCDDGRPASVRVHTVMPTDFDLWRREIGWPTPSSEPSRYDRAVPRGTPQARVLSFGTQVSISRTPSLDEARNEFRGCTV